MAIREKWEAGREEDGVRTVRSPALVCLSGWAVRFLLAAVLSGVILALLGMGVEPFRAAAAAVYLHGLAGDLCAEEKGEWGMVPGDMIAMLPRAIRSVLE